MQKSMYSFTMSGWRLCAFLFLTVGSMQFVQAAKRGQKNECVPALLKGSASDTLLVDRLRQTDAESENRPSPFVSLKKLEEMWAQGAFIADAPIVILDTNVLMNNPVAFEAYPGSNVVIPLKVIEELDGLKKRGGPSEDPAKSQKARAASRALERFLFNSDGNGEPIAPNSARAKVFIDPGWPLIVKNANHQMPILAEGYSADNVILNLAYGLNHIEGLKGRVTLVSNDFNVRIKARAYDVKAVTEGTQDLGKTNKNTFAGVLEYLAPSHLLAKAGNQKKLSLEDLKSAGIEETLYPNQFVLLASSESELATNPLIGFVRVPLNADGTRMKNADGSFDLSKMYLEIKDPIDGLPIEPLNVEQKLLLHLLLDPSISLVSVVGKAGSGKTLMALMASLMQTEWADLPNRRYESVLAFKKMVELGNRTMGFLPGGEQDKVDPYLAPYFDNLELLFTARQKAKSKAVQPTTAEGTAPQKKGRVHSAIEGVKRLVESGKLKMTSINFIRGRTLRNRIIIVDEAQNLTEIEIKTLVTRAGHGTKIILMGDPDQIDDPYLNFFNNGLSVVGNRFLRKPNFGLIELKHSVRSELAEIAAEVFSRNHTGQEQDSGN